MTNYDIIEKLLVFIRPLIEGIPGENLNEFEENQIHIAKIPHIVNCSDNAEQLRTLILIKEALIKGGITRMKITIPSVIWSYYRLSKLSYTEENNEGSEDSPTEEQLEIGSKINNIFEEALKTIELIYTITPEQSINLLLYGIQTMNLIRNNFLDLEENGMKFAKQIFHIFQTELADSDVKYRVITLIIGTLQSTSLFNSKNYTDLQLQTAKCCAKLLKKQDQCQAILQFSHMFFKESEVTNYI